MYCFLFIFTLINVLTIYYSYRFHQARHKRFTAQYPFQIQCDYDDPDTLCLVRIQDVSFTVTECLTLIYMVAMLNGYETLQMGTPATITIGIPAYSTNRQKIEFTAICMFLSLHPLYI